jgi:hypothetical protein
MKESFGNTFYFLLKRKFVGAKNSWNTGYLHFILVSILKEGEIPRNHDSGQQRTIYIC